MRSYFQEQGQLASGYAIEKNVNPPRNPVYKSLVRVEASLDSSSWVCLLNLALLPLQHPQGKRLLAGSHKDLNLNPGV